MKSEPSLTLLTYCPLPYNGKGVSRICMALLDNYAQRGLACRLVIPRVRNLIPSKTPVKIRQTLPLSVRKFPWKWISGLALPFQKRVFEQEIERCEPGQTACYFWPDTPIDLILQAKARGILTFREMINTYRGTAKAILDEAYAQLALPPAHGITQESTDLERQELALYDYVFAPSELVMESVREAGVPAERILLSSFGWIPPKYTQKIDRRSHQLTALFVGTVGVRKGVPQLLEAWVKSKIAGTLVIAGGVEEAIKPMVEHYRTSHNVTLLGFTKDVDALYQSADFFVFPTFEEGSPQVIFEAAGAGLPIITTPMGSAGLVENEKNGFIVDAGDIDGLSRAIATLAASLDLRRRFSARIAQSAREFTYAKVGRSRADTISELFAARSRRIPNSPAAASSDAGIP